MHHQNTIGREVAASKLSLGHLAKALGVSATALRARYSDVQRDVFTSATGPEPDDIRTLAKPGHERFVIAVKPCGKDWPAKYRDVLAEARRGHDRGTHEMYQSRHVAGWIVQYSFPRLVKRKPSDWFGGVVN